ncbi:hypothetical protein AB0D46_28965 [Streptomyces sp. NPDC048383]|uniref:hypothetical protein n=1 Tax=Streptomyces sp. NPDC048383 TaxID=3155386 RepID=UPI003428260F
MFPARSLIEAVTNRLGRRRTQTTDSAGEWQLAHHTIGQVDTVLAEQTAAAYAGAVDHAYLAAARNVDGLHVQPGLLEIHDRILGDTLYLEGLLTGARSRCLAPELIERLADAVDHGHALTLLIADTVRATTIDHTPTASPHQHSEPHQPVPYFAEAGTGACPHGDSPHARHTGCDEDVLICLDSPIGDHCPGCQDTAGEPVSWIHCPYRPASGDPQDGGTL